MTTARYAFIFALAVALGVVSVQIRYDGYLLKRELSQSRRTNDRILFETENAKLVFSAEVAPLPLTQRVAAVRSPLAPSQGDRAVWLTASVRERQFGPQPHLYPRRPLTADVPARATEEPVGLDVPDIVSD